MQCGEFKKLISILLIVVSVSFPLEDKKVRDIRVRRDLFLRF
jgi:hypothetical protein